MLIKTQVMLFEMNDSESNHRPVFSLVSLTANKKEWQRKQLLIAKANKLQPGKKQEALLQEARVINSGGTLLMHSKCVLMSARGKHSKAGQSASTSTYRATQNHYDNRTRNIQLLPSDSPVKTHFDLITHFNKQRVIH